ncbi:MAG: proteinase inhibitor I78 [Acidobacteria bacterium]|nr:proteinase inhibitor I78 [Acidobacteriota bacterium]
MHCRTVLLASVLAASYLTGACREATPSSPSPLTEGGPSQQEASQSGPIPSPPSPNPADPPATGGCDDRKAQWAVAQPASDELLERARVAAGAAAARFLRPDQPVTMEYLGSRLNLTLDARDVVRSVTCG